ncbi:MFS transporter [Caloranaerobacter azorensis]|uniref:MFS transporter n=1 Tax=Caloranaerobacter azorensis TaxID=116090 RepID=A0A6P1YCQ3_9FIRM|nr:MFS transporter [Caloranaerobacter azorensis]QIB26847.1 MFS transporter [Caloranaerobacter azorensis]
MLNYSRTLNRKSKRLKKIMISPIKEFLGFEQNIKRYMIMHLLGGGLLIYSSLTPIFMNKLGISIINAGLIFGLASVIDIIFTYVLSKFLDRISPNIGMTIDWLTESIPPLIYTFATTSFHMLLGVFSTKITNILNPVYKVYENEIFPEKQRDLLYTYHLMLPEIFTIIFYPIIGFLLTYKYTSLNAFRVVFFICAVGYIFIAIIPYKALKWVEPIKISKKNLSIAIPKNLLNVAIAQICVLAAISFTSPLITSYFILEKIGGTVFNILMLEVVCSVFVIITGIYSKNLTSKIPRQKIVQYGVMFFIIYAFLLMIAKNYVFVLIAFVFYAIGHTIWFPHHYSLLMEFVPKESRGQFFGSMSAINKLFGVCIPVISGILASKFGFFIPFSLVFILFIIVYIIYQQLMNIKQEN